MPARRSVALAVTGLVVLARCNNTVLPPATTANAVETVTLYALYGTAIGTPSAFEINGPFAVRTELSGVFDFAFNIDSVGRPVFLPSFKPTTTDTTTQPGFQLTSSAFADITLAPTGGYQISQPFPVASGNVILLHSRSQVCSDGTSATLYAKLQVLALDATARTIQFEILTDQNCGYRGLAPGIPQQ